jgi:hypothetical protein
MLVESFDTVCSMQYAVALNRSMTCEVRVYGRLVNMNARRFRQRCV